jgi:hypothetical protein
VAGRSWIRSLTLALSLAVSSGATVAAELPIRFSQPKPNHTPVTIIADEVIAPGEGPRRLLGLSGKVLIEQGVTQLRADQAIVWVNADPPSQGRTSHVIVYAEGSVQLENGSEVQRGSTALVELATFNGVNVHSPGGKVIPKAVEGSALYSRAIAARGQPGETKTDPAVQQAQFSSPPAPGAADNSPYLPLPVGPPSIDPVPGSSAPAAPPLQPGPTPGIQPATQVPLPSTATERSLLIAQRSSTPQQWKRWVSPDGKEEMILITNGVKVLARFRHQNHLHVLDVEADNLVLWRVGGGGLTQDFVDSLREGATQKNDSQIELFMSGNVVIRYGSDRDKRGPDGAPLNTQELRAEQVYYDVSRNRAIAVNGDLVFNKYGIAQPAHFHGDELWQLSQQEWRTIHGDANASKLPSDPGIQVTLAEATILERRIVRRTIFGLPFFNRETGIEEEEPERWFRGRRVALEVEGVPVLWFPYLAGNVEHPFGPLQGIGFRQDRVFGSQIYTTWDLFELIGTRPRPGERGQVYVDYLSERGPATGVEYDYAGKKMFGFDSEYAGMFKTYGIYDRGHDVLGGPRDLRFDPPALRGRIFWRHMQTLDDWSFQGQAVALSDPNFHEQYYKYEFDQAPNQETFAWLKYQHGTAAAALLVEPNLNHFWVTEAEALPRLDGWLIGESFWDRLTYNAWANVGYYHLRTTEVPPFPVYSTDQDTKTGRFDLMQELSAPFALGPLKIVPYGKVDLTWYTSDLNGDEQGRIYGGGGARASLPFSRLYPDITSELFNVNGIYHKVTLGGNYFAASTNVPFSKLPQIDQLDDDAVNQAIFGITPLQPTLVPGPAGLALRDSPIFNPQVYAIRRLVDWKTDTLDTMQVVQVDLQQRWQTKRGYPGMEHTVDWLTLDVSASFFPAPNRDNFGETVSFIEWAGTWAVGDRNGYVTTGWFDPFDVGTRYWTVGAYLDRPDRTHLYLGYRQFDPVRSKAVIGAVTYVFSPKYAITASAVYDFGTQQALSNSLVLTRIGTDLTVSLGFNYNVLINNFGFTFEIVPNLLAMKSGRGFGLSPFSNGR